MSSPRDVTVLGGGAWGTTLAWLLAGKGLTVRLWVREPELVETIRTERRNAIFMPDLPLPPSIEPTNDLAEALDGAPAVVVVVPSHGLRAVVSAAAEHFPVDALIVSATKGLERGSGMRMSQIIAEELGPERCSRLAALSGPNLSGEIAKGMPAVSVAASLDEETARAAQDLLTTPLFRVYSNCDIIGAELCGALKNVIAIAAGACDGLGYGDNAKAALLTRGLAEMGRIGVRLGAMPATFWGAAGIGDLAATCMSRLSRNWNVGWRVAHGETLAQIQESGDSVAEGIHTTTAACELADRLGVEAPIARAVQMVLFEGRPAAQVAASLMVRQSRAETEAWHRA